MKKLLFIFALFFSLLNVNAQKEKLDQLFEKYQETEGVTSIKIAKPMFSMLNKLNINDSELDQIKPILSKINGIKILIVEKPEAVATPGSEAKMTPLSFKNLQSDIAASIKNMRYEELITVNSKDNKIKFLSTDASNGILDDLLLNISSGDNTVLMMLDGKISMDDVNKMVSEAQNAASKSSAAPEKSASASATQVRNVGKFTGISASSGVKVNFTQGNNQSVTVDADADLQQYVVTEVKNGILHIGIDNRNNRKLNFKKLLVTVEAPRLSSVGVSSGANFMTVNTVREDSFVAEVSSGANLNSDVIARKSGVLKLTSGASARLGIDTENFTFSGTSGSSATVTGKANTANFELTSAASCNAQDLITSSAAVTASSGSSLKVHTTGSLRGEAGSGASVRYKGAPKAVSDIKTSSGGSIRAM